MFPTILHIDQVLPHVEGRSDFVVARREGYTVIDYLFAGDDTFDHPIRRECRGLKFGPDGRVIARPFHKFFNFGEKPETAALDLGVGHVVMHKLDGSMIHPAMVDGELVFMTRMGATDIAARAQAFASPEVIRFCRNVLDAGDTPIFEWCSPDNRIVVPYAEPRLSLLAIREMATGAYHPWSFVAAAAGQHGVSVVETVEPIRDASAFVAHTRGLIGAEGYVVRFDTGLTVKIKADDYVLRHRSKDQIGLEKNALGTVLRGQVDDLVPLLPDHDAAALARYAVEVEARVSELTAAVHRTLADGAGVDRKTFALEHASMLPVELKGCAFMALDGRATPREAVLAALGRHTGSATDVERIRPLLNGLRWSDYYSTVSEAA